MQYYVAAEISRRRRQLAAALLDRADAAARRGIRRASARTTTATACPISGRPNNSVSNPSEDADNDGLSNLQEYQAGTNPRISNVWNLSEGATGFFAQRLALSNPDGAPADISIKYLRAGGKPPVTRDYTVLPTDA